MFIFELVVVIKFRKLLNYNIIGNGYIFCFLFKKYSFLFLQYIILLLCKTIVN